ncbi:MAG TPA: sugar ABC transporter substrate-binding protein, partial [Roseiarcus sp.]
MVKNVNATPAARRGPSRRAVVGGGVAVAAITGFPYVSRGLAAQTLKFWQFYGPGGGVATQDKWFEDVVKGWNDSHEVKVELVYVPNNAYMDGTKLPTAFASGSGPDLFIISPGDFLRYYNGGVLLDLTPFMEQASRDDFFPSVIANRMVDGKIYGLPYEVEPMAMYYSVDAFKEIGLTDNDVPKTWDDLLSVAKKLTNAKRFGVLFETSPGYYQNFTWYPFLWEAGGDFQTKDGKSAFNSPATVQALKFWQDSINMSVAPRKPLGGGAWDAVPNLGSGYCAMQNVGIWAIAQLREGAPDFKYGIFKLPTPPGGKYITIGGGWAFVANARGWNPKAAGEFCAWAIGSPKDGSVGRIVDWCTKTK